MSKGNKKAAKPISRFRNATDGTTYTKQAPSPKSIAAAAAAAKEAPKKK